MGGPKESLIYILYLKKTEALSSAKMAENNESFADYTLTTDQSTVEEITLDYTLPEKYERLGSLTVRVEEINKTSSEMLNRVLRLRNKVSLIHNTRDFQQVLLESSMAHKENFKTSEQEKTAGAVQFAALVESQT